MDVYHWLNPKIHTVNPFSVTFQDKKDKKKKKKKRKVSSSSSAKSESPKKETTPEPSSEDVRTVKLFV